jgi:rod shape-determining protein MreC
VLSRRNRTVAILETDDGQHFFMRVRSHEDFQVGDTIVTSGLGGIYPRGLEVGIVKDIKAGSDPLFKRVFIRPAVDFEHLEELFVIRLSPQWASFLSEMDSIEFNGHD